MQNHRAHAHGNVRLCSVAHSLYAIVLWSNFALYVLLNGTILAPRSMQCCIHMASEINKKKRCASTNVIGGTQVQYGLIQGYGRHIMDPYNTSVI